MIKKNVGLLLLVIVITSQIATGSLSVGINEDGSGGRIGIDLNQDTTSSDITNVYNNYTYNGSDLTLNDLSDVSVPTPNDGDSLVWDSGLSKWIASVVTSATNWFISSDNGYIYNDTDTIYFNESKLNNTIDARSSVDLSNIFYEYYTSSRMDTVIENLSEADNNIVYEIVQPGEHYVYGGFLE
jgi:hypothetical protein